jgi:hypothetical protein
VNRADPAVSWVYRIIINAALRERKRLRPVATEDRRRNRDRLMNFYTLRVGKIPPLLQSEAILTRCTMNAFSALIVSTGIC